jgi:molybdopterin converting factor small subunit
VRITVRYLSILEDLSGTAREELEVPDGIDVAELLRTVAAAHGAPIERHMVSVLIRGRHVSADRVLDDGDEAVLIPRLSGG